MQALKLANIPEITFVDLYADDFRRENSNMGCSNKFRNPDDRKSQIIMRIQKTRQIELRTTLQSYNINNVSRFFFDLKRILLYCFPELDAYFLNHSCDYYYYFLSY